MTGKRSLSLVLALVVCLPLLGLRAPGRSAEASNPTAECAQVAWYAGLMKATGKQIDAKEASGPSMDAVETWTPEDYDQVIAFYDSVIATLNAITPPPMATEFHRTFVEAITLFRQVLVAMKQAGPFAVLAFMQPIEALNQKLAEQAALLHHECGIEIFDPEEQAALEAGMRDATPAPANPASPVAGALGETTVPIGATVQTSDAFSLTVVSVDQDALAAVQAANPGATPPDGFQYVNAEIKLGHLHEGHDTFELENLIAIGPTGVAYSAVNNSCGFVNGPLPGGEYGGTLAMTGHVCWVIASQDVHGLRLYDASQPADERVYLSLDPTFPS